MILVSVDIFCNTNWIMCWGWSFIFSFILYPLNFKQNKIIPNSTLYFQRALSLKISNQNAKRPYRETKYGTSYRSTLPRFCTFAIHSFFSGLSLTLVTLDCGGEHGGHCSLPHPDTRQRCAVHVLLLEMGITRIYLSDKLMHDLTFLN